MIDAVISHHLNPATCGVAKFNHRLAAELGVPLKRLGDTASHPLVSIKPSETPDWWSTWLPSLFDLFLHERPQTIDRRAVEDARRVFAANAEIADALRRIRTDVYDAYCPATIHGQATRAPLTILTFGMAHKLQLPLYRKLRDLLEHHGKDYTMCLSTAIHEGSPWDLMATAGDQLREVFGDHLRVLGFLADDALAKELHECTAVALFFEPALRANNTTFWAAVDAKKRIITNLDRWSPTPSGLSLIEDITTMTTWSDFPFVQYMSGTPDYTWNNLTRMLRG